MFGYHSEYTKQDALEDEMIERKEQEVKKYRDTIESFFIDYEGDKNRENGLYLVEENDEFHLVFDFDYISKSELENFVFKKMSKDLGVSKYNHVLYQKDRLKNTFNSIKESFIEETVYEALIEHIKEHNKKQNSQFYKLINPVDLEEHEEELFKETFKEMLEEQKEDGYFIKEPVSDKYFDSFINEVFNQKREMAILDFSSEQKIEFGITLSFKDMSELRNSTEPVYLKKNSVVCLLDPYDYLTKTIIKEGKKKFVKNFEEKTLQEELEISFKDKKSINIFYNVEKYKELNIKINDKKSLSLFDNHCELKQELNEKLVSKSETKNKKENGCRLTR